MSLSPCQLLSPATYTNEKLFMPENPKLNTNSNRKITVCRESI